MTENSSFYPHQSEPSLRDCGLCFEPVSFTCSGDTAPVHDPLTGDMICGECKLKQPSLGEASMVEESDRPLLSSGALAYPLYLLKASQNNDSKDDGTSLMDRMDDNSTSDQAETLPIYDKCLHHGDVDWVFADMDSMTCVCTECSQRIPNHTYQKLGKAVPTIRKQIADILITPLIKRGCNSPSVPSMDDDGGESQLFTVLGQTINLIQLALEMDRTVNILTKWMNEVVDVRDQLCNKVSQLRTIAGERAVRRQLDLAIHWRDRQFQDAGNIYLHHLQSMIRVRQVISGTLLEAMKLLGLDINKYGGSLTRSNVSKVLRERDKKSPVTVGEEVVVLRTLSCLKETLENGDPLLVEMIERNVDDALNHTDGIRTLLLHLKETVANVSCEHPDHLRRKGRLLTEVRSLLDATGKVVPLLLAPQSETWKTSLAKVKEETVREKVLNDLLDVILYEYGGLKPLTYSGLHLVDKTKPVLGEGDTLLIDGMLQKDLEPSFAYFFNAVLKGCKHPRVYTCLGGCYRDDGSGAVRSSTNALAAFEIAIAGKSFPLCHPFLRTGT